MQQTATERRRSARVRRECAAKLYHARSRRYVGALTCDVSGEGARLRVIAGRDLRVGDDLEVLIRWSPRGLVNAADAVEGKVRWVEKHEGEQQVGVEWAGQPHDQPR
jgi:hypothetical protein